MKFKDYIQEQSKTYKPPASVAVQAQRALDYKEKYGDAVNGGTQVGWTRANQLAKREPVSLDIIKRMVSFFARHDGNQKVNDEYKNEPYKDAGFISWLLWGSDAGRKWAESIVKDLEDE